MKIRYKIKNVIGILIAKYIIGKTLEDSKIEGWIITGKNERKQIIKVFSLPAYKNIVRPAIGRIGEMHE